MKKNKLGILSLLILAITFSMIGLVNATEMTGITLNRPVTNGEYTGTITFSATVTPASSAVKNVTFYYSTNGITWTYIRSNSTADATQEVHTLSVNTGVNFTDGASYTINATAWNRTGGGHVQTTATGVEMDNTNPTASLKLDKSFVSKGSPIFADCSGSSDSVDTALTYFFTLTKSDSSIITNELANSSSKTYTFSGVDTSPVGPGYSINCRVTDNVGKISSATNLTFDVRSTGDGGVIEPTEPIKKAEEQKKSNTLLYLLLLIIIIVIIVIVFATQPGSKKRRR